MRKNNMRKKLLDTWLDIKWDIWKLWEKYYYDPLVAKQDKISDEMTALDDMCNDILSLLTLEQQQRYALLMKEYTRLDEKIYG